MDNNNLPFSDNALKKRHQRIHRRLAAWEDPHTKLRITINQTQAGPVSINS
jgi:hypothetical protein